MLWVITADFVLHWKEASLEDESLEIGGRDLNLSDVAFIIFCKSSSVPE